MRRLLALFLIPTSYFLFPTSVLAGDYQQCTSSSTCTIGEYLYNDDYTPLTAQSCTLTAKYPDGTTYLNAVAMTGAADGWYKYDASIGTTTGLYHATLCCTPSSGLMCLDKTFEVKDAPQAQLTAADVWNYSGRTLTSFGSLISDIWGHSTRTLTSFGTLVADITGVASPSPTATTLQTIISEQKEQRDLLERLVNAPIVTLELEDAEAPDLSLKIEESQKQAGLLYDLIQSTKSRLLTLDTKWGTLGATALSSELTSLSSSFNQPAPLTALTTAWNTPVTSALERESIAVKTALTTLLTSTSVTSSSLPPASLSSALVALSSLETTLGDVTSASGDNTLYGYLASVSEKDQLFKAESQKLSAVLEDWDTQGETVLGKRVNDSQSRLLAINEFPGGEGVITPSNPKASGKSALKNLVFSLQGLIGLNQNLLASAANAPVRGLWLEEGSVIFRAVITNPSDITTQDAQLKFFLPKELKNEDILTIDPSLTATYDTVAETLAVTGTYELAPSATKIVALEVEDVWQLSEAELTTLKTKANDLLKPLEKSNLLSQGVVLKGNIESILNDLMRAQSGTVKPENRIRSYREAQLALLEAKSNLTELETLVAQASSTGTLIGFVGGVSTTAVFGIVLVVVAGFVFMSLYFKKLGLAPVLDTPGVLESTADDIPGMKGAHIPGMLESPRLSTLSSLEFSPTSAPKWQMPAIIAVVVVVTAGGTLLLTRSARQSTPPVINQVIVTSPSPIPTPPAPSVVPDTVGDEVESPTFTLAVPEDSSVNIRNRPSSEGDIIMAIKESVDVLVFKESGDWRQIGFSEADKTKGYWVHAQFISGE